MAARRGRRFGWRKDVRRHPEGSAETGLPPATREKRRACRTDPAVFQPNRAPDVPVRHARRRASIAWRLRGFPRFARCRWRRPACPQSPPSQRDRSRRHKPPNGAPEGVTLNYSKRGTAGAPSDQPMTPDWPSQVGMAVMETGSLKNEAPKRARHFFSLGGRRSKISILALAKC